MLTERDYHDYFTGIETLYKKILLVYTDLINEVSDQSVRNKLYVMISEDEESFKVIKEFNKKFL